MPNLGQSKALREKYPLQAPISGIQPINQLNVNTIEALTKNFSLRANQVNESLDIKLSLQPKDREVFEFLEMQRSAKIVTLFIDITDFSKKCKNMSNALLSKYLDDYYDIAIPIIYLFGGEVERINGDGIVCIFGKPFLSEIHQTLLKHADCCAKMIIHRLIDTDMAVKVALHEGEIMYYKNKTNFTEYTMVGKPVTELFRLEGVSESNAINYYCHHSLEYGSLYNARFLCPSHNYITFNRQPTTKINPLLNGVDYTEKACLKHE